jgi:hypothetical protein
VNEGSGGAGSAFASYAAAAERLEEKRPRVGDPVEGLWQSGY